MQYDLVIVGGGMVGASLALAAAGLQSAPGQPLSVALIEPHAPGSDQQPSFDARAIALGWGSRHYLGKLGVWDAMAPRVEAIRHIHVSERGGWGLTRLHHDSYGLPALGYVVEVRDLGRVLWQAMEKHDNITCLCPAELESLEQHPAHVELGLTDGRGLAASLLVAADGARSRARGLLALPLYEHDYQQQALIATVEAAEPHQGWAFERFTDSGPMALLPMTDNRLSLVWSARPERAVELAELGDGDFLQQLQQRFGWRLGRFTRVAGRHSYPLVLRQARQLISHRAALVGNAAHALHPIAGQGYNLGLRDVAVLAEVMAAAIDQGMTWGGYPMLADYQRRRQSDNSLTVGASDALVTLFSNDHWPLKAGRNLGVTALDWVPGAKAAFGWQAMGV